MDKIEEIVGILRPPMAEGNFNVARQDTGNPLCLCWMDITNAFYFFLYYKKHYPQFKFMIIERRM